MSAMLDENCELQLYTIKFHVLHHGLDELKWFRCLEVLDAQPVERLSVHMNTVYITISHTQSLGMVEQLVLCMPDAKTI